MVTTEQIKELRDKTGISVMQCKKALEESGGDMGKALVILRKVSKDIATKKFGRTLGAGVISAYIHSHGNVGAMVELCCETDFVAKNAEFKSLAYDIAMHVTASNPSYLKKEDISDSDKKSAEEVFVKEVAGKPDNLKQTILDGKLTAYFKDKILLEQDFIKNPEITIRGLIDAGVQKFGEKMELVRYVRFSAGDR